MSIDVDATHPPTDISGTSDEPPADPDRCHCLRQPAVLAMTENPDWCVECTHPASAHEDAGGCTWETP